MKRIICFEFPRDLDACSHKGRDKAQRAGTYVTWYKVRKKGCWTERFYVHVFDV